MHDFIHVICQEVIKINYFYVDLYLSNVLDIFKSECFRTQDMLNRVMKKMKILICRILKAVHYRVYKCTAILHTPMGRTHEKNSMSKLDNDAKRVANIYMELPCSKILVDKSTNSTDE